MFPTDDSSTGFDLYRKSGNEEEVKLNEEPITLSTNFQDITADRNKDNTYRLCFAGSDETLDTYTITAVQASAGLPYIPYRWPVPQASVQSIIMMPMMPVSVTWTEMGFMRLY